MSTWRKLATTVGYATVVLVLAAGAFWLGSHATQALGVAPSIAWSADGAPEVSSRAAMIGGQRVGEVVIEGTIVIRMRTDAGGFTAPERAEMIANRFQRWFSGPFSPYDLRVRETAGGSAELRAAGMLLATANPQEAALVGSTALGLAQAWHDNVMMALGVGGPGGAAGATAATRGGEWTPSEPYGDKFVPIISVLEGVRVGMARVNGPESKLDQVNAVAQLETRFRDFLEIDIYVPITTDRPGPGGLDRVQQVGVTGIADIRL
ncbi:MAG: hypothetical protein AB7Y46_00620 [Armatimonadota bacterium]